MADQEEEAKAKKEVRVFGRPELASKVAMFQRKAEDHDRKQKDNPFSERWDGSASSALSKDDPRYGHPEEGSKTEKRGQQAGQLISSEVRVLCENVHEFGTEQPDGTRAITFGELFQLYTSISNKVVGILLRARKHGLIDFEGEMLYQRRDDGVVIRLLRPIAEIHAEMGYNSALAQLPKTTPVLLGGKTAPS
nr:actin-binding Rho-activating protein-like [Rhipicephalus microplus]XP_037268443.1 actin-binding Rho-activating protein-like [Rhipicephalus microplus]